VQVGLYQWLSGVIDNALYPILFLDYLKHQFPVFGQGAVRTLSLFGITAVSPPVPELLSTTAPSSATPELQDLA
jgi:hypothetical protein